MFSPNSTNTTPKRGPSSFSPSTPGTSSTQRSIMDCSSNPDDFQIVQIHTAKCAICDERNMATMRRCPGCTYQICQPCFNKRTVDGVSLAHGNMGNAASATTTPVRRRLFQLAPLGGATPRGGGLGPSDVIMQDADNAGTAADMKQSTPKLLPGSGKRGRVVKGKVVLKDGDVSDDEYKPGIEANSPTPIKRRKTSDMMVGEVFSSTRRATRGQGEEQTSAAPRFSPFSMSGENMDASTGRQLDDYDAAELLAEFGVGAETRPYQQHLLGRPSSVMSNPVIKIPENVRRNFKPRLTASDIQKNIQDKVRKKLNGGAEDIAGGGPSESASGSESAQFEPKNETVRDFVKAEAQKLHQGIELHEDQQATLLAMMSEAARKLANRIYSTSGELIRKFVKPGLDMQIGALDDDKKEELKKTVQDEGARILKDFEEEAVMHASISTPSKQTKPLLVSKASSSPTMPPVGFFQVSRSRSISRPNLGDALPQSRSVDVNRLSPGTNSIAPVHGGATAGRETQHAETHNTQVGAEEEPRSFPEPSRS